MTPFLCVFAAWVLIYLPLFVSMQARKKLPGGFDNNHPREQLAKLEGPAKRAVAAHQNAHENFAPFAASVFVAHLGHANPAVVSGAAIAFVVLRTAYPLFYVFDVASARSVTWMLGMVCTALLFLSPLLAPAA